MATFNISLRALSRLGLDHDAVFLSHVLHPFHEKYQKVSRKKFCPWKKIAIVTALVFSALGLIMSLGLIYLLIEDYVLRIEIISGILVFLSLGVVCWSIWRQFIRNNIVDYQMSIIKLFRWMNRRLPNVFNHLACARVLTKVSLINKYCICDICIDSKYLNFYTWADILLVVKENKNVEIDDELMGEILWIKYAMSGINKILVSSIRDCEVFNLIEDDYGRRWKDIIQRSREIDLYNRIYVANIMFSPQFNKYFWQDELVDIDAVWISLHNPDSQFYRYFLDDGLSEDESSIEEEQSSSLIIYSSSKDGGT